MSLMSLFCPSFSIVEILAPFHVLNLHYCNYCFSKSKVPKALNDQVILGRIFVYHVRLMATCVRDTSTWMANLTCLACMPKNIENLEVTEIP